MRQGLLAPACLINIQGLDALRGIEMGAWHPEIGTHLSIGAVTTHAEAARSRLLGEQYLALGETFRGVATPRIRNAGTVGGSLAHGDPHQDPPVTLLALDAWVALQSIRGTRAVPLTQFFRDYYETVLQPDEILTHVLVPARPPRSGLAFIKFLPRSQDDYATVDVAAWVRLAEHSALGAQGSPAVEEARIALGSVGPVPVRALEAERLLAGHQLTDELLAEAGAEAAAACDPEDDVRGSRSYKRELVRVLVRRAVRQALNEARGQVSTLS